MKYYFTSILLVMLSQVGTSQIDMIEDGLLVCQNAKDFDFVYELFSETEDFAFAALEIENKDYKALVELFCQTSETDRFVIEENSKLSQLIREGIKEGFWVYDKYDPNAVTVIDGDTVEVVPPGGGDSISPPPESIEQAYISGTSSFIQCSKDYVFHKGMMFYYKSYDSYKVAPSNVKLCSMKEFFADEDYALTSIQHFVLIHCICQRIIHENRYYSYFE